VKKYQVLITHDITESRTVIVEAEDPEEAMEKAHDMAFESTSGTPWEKNDCGDCPGAYCAGGVDDVEEIKEGGAA
jgi:hypothetical protein